MDSTQLQLDFDYGIFELPTGNIKFIKDFKTSLQTRKLEFPFDSTTDLVSKVYEGGFKVWECTFDLLRYLECHNGDLQGKRILDLGCGQGLLGVYCLRQGAEFVEFQDYNKDVLDIATQSIIQQNLNSIDLTNKVGMWSGDWNNYNVGNKYDIVLASETIYNPDNYNSLAKLFIRVTKPNGIIVLASKDYYFGVGGSVNGFLEYLNGFSSELEYKVIEEIKGKSAYKRKIIVIAKK